MSANDYQMKELRGMFQYCGDQLMDSYFFDEVIIIQHQDERLLDLVQFTTNPYAGDVGVLRVQQRLDDQVARAGRACCQGVFRIEPEDGSKDPNLYVLLPHCCFESCRAACQPVTVARAAAGS